MTLPAERTRAILSAEAFLHTLALGAWPRTPKAVRDRAGAILRHYPMACEVALLAIRENPVPHQELLDATEAQRLAYEPLDMRIAKASPP